MLLRVVGIRFRDDVFATAASDVLLAASHGHADAGEVLDVLRRSPEGDADAWVAEWTAAAGAAWAAGRAADTGGHRVSALTRYRHAAAYYAVAVALVPYSSEPERHRALWRRQRACWDRSVELLPVPGERLEIPYEHTVLPAYFFPSATAEPGERGPLVIVVHGEGPTSHALVCGGAAACERGYHWMTFDGPGREAALFEQRLALRPDWEAVLTPVVDAMARRPEVDPERIAIIATGAASRLVLRGLTAEHRLAAAVADPGVLDASAPWMSALDGALREMLASGDRETFERAVHAAELLDPPLAAALAHRGEPFLPAGGSRFALFEAVAAHRLDGELASLATPLLVTDAGRPWAGQAARLAELLPGRAELLPPDADSPSPAAHQQRIFDWLDLRLA